MIVKLDAQQLSRQAVSSAKNLRSSKAAFVLERQPHGEKRLQTAGLIHTLHGDKDSNGKRVLADDQSQGAYEACYNALFAELTFEGFNP
ncbi:hypothetical protein [Microcoleus sp.]|uniref:hypothetical protein n=1 Tax=Microcoleus sp. TaxID=44472 RepID=UPI00403EA519